MKQVTIIDYGSGNLHSIAKATQKVAKDKNIKVVVSSLPEELTKADYIILPGVGAFADCIDGLSRDKNLLDNLLRQVSINKKPFLGVCVGMQMLSDWGFENGEHKGLGLIHGKVIKIEDSNLKVPHMGWNELIIKTPHPILKNIKSGDHAYFVHSYHFVCEDKGAIIATTSYGRELVAILAKENIIACQFHPEKSQEVGLTLLRNFLEI